MNTLTAYYDLAVGPVSFDFVVFATKAKMAAYAMGADKVHMVVVPFERGVGGMFRDKTALYDVHEMRWRLWNIIMPACNLLDMTVTLATGWDQAVKLAGTRNWPPDWRKQTLKDRQHLVGGIIAMAKQGQQVPLVNASMHATRKVRELYRLMGKPVVTMTLRKTYLTERNSETGDWLRARHELEQMGYAVVTMQDTDVALSQGQGYGELNLDLRLACYQQAVMNLQANNGAASLCWLSNAPYLMFGAGVPAEEWDGLFVKQGLPLGTTWPWAKPDQRLVYGRPSTEQLVAEFKRAMGV